MITFDNYEEPCYHVNGSDRVFIGRTPNVIHLFHYVNHLANLPVTVLIMGETGTGKELIAKALHENGPRRNAQFVPINCAGIPYELLESELFGYKKGAFTGAHRDTIGKFQYAHRGTIFFDEISEMPLGLQPKLLRVLQEREVTPVGSNQSQQVDVRVIAATNRELEEEIKKGTFREDLFYRLNVIPINIPPLRDRKEDIPSIAEHLVGVYNRRYNANRTGLTREAQEQLQGHDWKGNVRELENVIERAFVSGGSDLITPDELYINGNISLQFFSHTAERSHLEEVVIDERQLIQRNPLLYLAQCIERRIINEGLYDPETQKIHFPGRDTYYSLTDVMYISDIGDILPNSEVAIKSWKRKDHPLITEEGNRRAFAVTDILAVYLTEISRKNVYSIEEMANFFKVPSNDMIPFADFCRSDYFSIGTNIITARNFQQRFRESYDLVLNVFKKGKSLL